MLNLDTLKSAVVIEDPDEIHKALSERKSGSPQTRIDRTKDGHPKVMKAGGAPRAGDSFSVEELRALTDQRGMPWDDAYAGRVIAYWGSDERVDAHGEIVRQNWIFHEFEKNSPMPFSHGWEELPVGRVLDWEVRQREEKDYTGDALWLLGLFATPEQYGFADSVYRLAKAAILPGGSVGFVPEVLIRVEDPKERAKLGLPDHGAILDRNHLLEYSPTLLGANPGALGIYSQAKSAGLLEARDFRVVRELQRQQIKAGEGDADAWRSVEKHLRGIQRLLFPKSSFEDHPNLDEPLELREEEETLRGLVPVEGLKTIEERTARLESVLSEALPSLMAVCEDIRTTVEELKDRSSVQGNGTNSEPAPDSLGDQVARLEALFSRTTIVN